jgi:hypothetical protein
LYGGDLWHPVDKYQNIIDEEISQKSKEIIVILTISNNGKKKEIRFLCDGNETKSTDVSEILKGDRLYPAIVLGHKNDLLFPAVCLYAANHLVETIPLVEIEIRTPAVERLFCEENNFFDIEGIFFTPKILSDRMSQNFSTNVPKFWDECPKIFRQMSQIFRQIVPKKVPVDCPNNCPSQCPFPKNSKFKCFLLRNFFYFIF